MHIGQSPSTLQVVMITFFGHRRTGRKNNSKNSLSVRSEGVFEILYVIREVLLLTNILLTFEWRQMICFSVERNTFLSACPQVACHAQENERQTINATVLIGLNKIPDSSGTTISPSSEIKKCPDFLAEIPRTRSKLSMRFSSLSPNESVIKALMGTRGNVAVWKVWGVQNNIAILTKQCSLNRFQRFVRGYTQLYPASRVSLDIPSQTQLWVTLKIYIKTRLVRENFGLRWKALTTKAKLVVVVKLFFGEKDLQKK